MGFEKKGGNKTSKLCPCACRWRCKCLPIKVNKKSHPPFNSGVSIDVKLGMHPKLAINSTDAPPPGYYNPKLIVSDSTHVTSWKREEAIKEFAATMGGRIPEKYTMQRRLMKSGLGPGTHELKQWPEIVLEKNFTLQLNRDRGFGGNSRFENSHRKATPGPGYTGKDHNPYYFIDRNRFKSYSNLPTFEFDGLAPRFKNPCRKWSLASNRYNPQHPYSLDNFLKKVTSRRGPYDLFTGPRDRSTLTGYQTQPAVSIDSKNWPFKFPTKYETTYGGSNRYKGVWTGCPRFTKKPTIRSMLEDISLCYKDPDSPGPGFYDPVSPSTKSITQMIHPFNDSVKNARPSPYCEIGPGPGTYSLITAEKRIPGNGWTWTFKSKVQRSLGPKADQYNSF